MVPQKTVSTPMLVLARSNQCWIRKDRKKDAAVLHLAKRILDESELLLITSLKCEWRVHQYTRYNRLICCWRLTRIHAMATFIANHVLLETVAFHDLILSVTAKDHVDKSKRNNLRVLFDTEDVV